MNRRTPKIISPSHEPGRHDCVQRRRHVHLKSHREDDTMPWTNTLSHYTKACQLINIKPPTHPPGYNIIYIFVSGFGLAVGVRLVSRGTSVRIRFDSPFSSKIVVCGHCLVPLSLTINEILKWLSSLPILMQKSFWW